MTWVVDVGRGSRLLLESGDYFLQEDGVSFLLLETGLWSSASGDGGGDWRPVSGASGGSWSVSSGDDGGGDAWSPVTGSAGGFWTVVLLSQ